MFTHPQEIRTPSHRRVTWDDKHPLDTPHFLLLPPVILAERDVMRFGIPLWSFGVTCLSCVPSQFLVHPQPPWWQGSTKSRKGLYSVQALCSNKKKKKKIHLCIIKAFFIRNTKDSPILATVKKINFIPGQISTLSFLLHWFRKKIDISNILLQATSYFP